MCETVKLFYCSLLLPVRREWGVAGWSMSCQRISHKRLSLLWEGAALSLWLCCCCCWTSSAAAGAAAAAAGQGDGAPGSLSWLLSDKGPFHQSLEFTEAAERHQQGYSTRYKIYRWDRWGTLCMFTLYLPYVKLMLLHCIFFFQGCWVSVSVCRFSFTQRATG